MQGAPSGGARAVRDRVDKAGRDADEWQEKELKVLILNHWRRKILFAHAVEHKRVDEELPRREASGEGHVGACRTGNVNYDQEFHGVVQEATRTWWTRSCTITQRSSTLDPNGSN